jgi:hypothetical protein
MQRTTEAWPGALDVVLGLALQLLQLHYSLNSSLDRATAGSRGAEENTCLYSVLYSLLCFLVLNTPSHSLSL